MDRQPADLARKGASERVAHRGVDLAGDLGDRHAVRHGQLQLDLEPVVEPDVDPGLTQAEPPHQSLER